MSGWLPLTVQDQHADLTRNWPTFRMVTFDAGRGLAVWRGTLHPRFDRYAVEIAYSTDMVVSGPRVRVLSPELIRQPGNPEGSLPHVYQRDTDPYLCLFDPRAAQWSGWMSISETTVPWTIDWLTCYEDWLLTGEWHGGGRHVTASVGSFFDMERFA
ncbi:hypothetical protein [Rhizobium sp. PP-CC-3G-465]|uniref:hypothetical protein n=1 Tax=Rhizobium sp. PP-CC-3G-465 TaxID=2135648 RepID=UPI0010D609E0|nr:hypothetical protein C8J33_10335 [Rhizobium sp. PP-CC-3G-465]